jgi:hypothetical protein
MYVYIKIGKHVFTFGNDRKGVERRKEDTPVKGGHRKNSERRKEEPSTGQSVEEKKGD